MWREALLDYLSRPPATDTSTLSLLTELPSNLAMYSGKFNSDSEQTLYALHNSYVDTMQDGKVGLGQTVFALNTFELDRESYKLDQQLELLKLTAARLDPAYLNEMVRKPIKAAVDFAESDWQASETELHLIEMQKQAGAATGLDVAQATARAAERNILYEKALIDQAQKEVEIAVQTRRMNAQMTDLTKRKVLCDQIRGLYSFVMPRAGIVTLHTFSGAYVEKGDPICTIAM